MGGLDDAAEVVGDVAAAAEGCLLAEAFGLLGKILDEGVQRCPVSPPAA